MKVEKVSINLNKLKISRKIKHEVNDSILFSYLTNGSSESIPAAF